MKKNPSILMAALTLSAIVLGVVLLATPPKAQALMLNNEPGLTMMTSGQAQSGDELLIIVDKASGKMLVYRLNSNNFELMGSTDINTIFQTTPSR